MLKDPYVRAVSNIEVLDGDTFRCDLDLGFHVRVRMSCRLAGINAAEHNQPGGPEARAALVELLGRGTVSVQSIGVDKYAGRFDAEVFVTGRPDRKHVATAWHVNRVLVDEGYAVPWDATGECPHVPWPRVPAAAR